jgi:hypothetical protein
MVLVIYYAWFLCFIDCLAMMCTSHVHLCTFRHPIETKSAYFFTEHILHSRLLFTPRVFFIFVSFPKRRQWITTPSSVRLCPYCFMYSSSFIYAMHMPSYTWKMFPVFEQKQLLCYPALYKLWNCKSLNNQKQRSIKVPVSMNFERFLNCAFSVKVFEKGIAVVMKSFILSVFNAM